MILNPLTNNNIADYHRFLEQELQEGRYAFPGDPLDIALMNENQFGWKAYGYLIYDSRKLSGFLIFNRVGQKLVSLPHSSYSGFHLPTKEVHRETIDKLLLQTKTFPSPSPSLWQLRLLQPAGYKDTRKVASWIRLSNKKKTWERLSSNLRRKIRRAVKSGLTCRNGSAEWVDAFFKVYSSHMQSIGSFSLPKDCINYLLQQESTETQIFLTMKSGEIVGAGLLLGKAGFYENILFAVNPNYYSCYAGDYLHWKMIEYIAERDGKVYSMGRSTRRSSVHHYKSHWPTEDVPLFWNTNKPGKRELRYIIPPKKLIQVLPSGLHRYLSKQVYRIIY